MAKTSLEKSHSAASNAKLTAICLLLAIFFAVLFTGLGILLTPIVEQLIAIIILAIGGVGTLLCLLALSSFKR